MRTASDFVPCLGREEEEADDEELFEELLFEELLEEELAVGGKPIGFLEAHDGCFGLAAEMTAERAGIVAELVQILLKLENRVAAHVVAQGRRIRRGNGRAGGRGAGRTGRIGDAGGFIQRRARRFIDDAVVLKRVFFLEFLDGGFGLFAVVTGDAGAVQLELLERGLNGRDFICLIAKAVTLR